MFNKIEKNDFGKVPIFFKCPVCKEIGFIYIGRKLYMCNNCNIVIAEDKAEV